MIILLNHDLWECTESSGVCWVFFGGGGSRLRLLVSAPWSSLQMQIQGSFLGVQIVKTKFSGEWVGANIYCKMDPQLSPLHIAPPPFHNNLL